MSIHDAKSRAFSTNGLFSAFLLGGIGWGLLHAWGINLKIGILFQALAAMPGLALSGIVIYRYRKHWPVEASECTGQGELSWDLRAIAFYLVLIAVGLSIALLISGGSLFLLALAAMGTIFVPWTRIALCRNHFFFSASLVGIGALLGLVLLDSPAHPLYYLMVAWLLLSLAGTLVMLAIVTNRNRSGRTPVSGH